MGTVFATLLIVSLAVWALVFLVEPTSRRRESLGGDGGGDGHCSGFDDGCSGGDGGDGGDD